MIKQYKNKRKKRHLRVRAKIKGTASRPRLSVFRSNTHIYAQIIDDETGNTLVAASDLKLANTEDTEKSAETRKKPKHLSASASSALQRLQGSYSKVEIAKLVGQELGKKALEKDIKSVVFDRGGYKYHGRVKALAEGAREGGLIF